jgi:hypothetical protein
MHVIACDVHCQQMRCCAALLRFCLQHVLSHARMRADCCACLITLQPRNTRLRCFVTSAHQLCLLLVIPACIPPHFCA